MLAKRMFCGGLALFVLALCGPVKAQSELTFSEPRLIGQGGSPTWSPDGQKLAFRLGGILYIADAPTFEEKRAVGDAPDYGFQWVGDSLFAWVETGARGHGASWRNVSKLYTMDLSGNVRLVEADSVTHGDRRLPKVKGLLPSADGTLAYLERTPEAPDIGVPKVLSPSASLGKKASSGEQPKYAFIKNPTDQFSFWGDIWIASIDGSFLKQVTHGPDTWCLPVSSPRGDLVAATNDRGEIVVLDTAGTVISNAGRGDVPSWSPDGRYIAFIVNQETEFEIIGSEVYVWDRVENRRQQLTDTPEIIELSVCWSPNGHYLAIRTANTGEIYIVTVEEVQR